MVLVTGFKPFAGRSCNGSQTLAAQLGGSVVEGYPVISEILDVVWGAPERELSRWIAAVRPALVLGIGEGQGDALRFELRAHNGAEGRDESGADPPNAPYLRSGGRSVSEATMVFDPCWVADLAPAALSEDAGRFLCNAWLYSALEICPCPVGFVHVPVQGDTSGADFLALWEPAIREILGRNVRG